MTTKMYFLLEKVEFPASQILVYCRVSLNVEMLMVEVRKVWGMIDGDGAGNYHHQSYHCYDYHYYHFDATTTAATTSTYITL